MPARPLLEAPAPAPAIAITIPVRLIGVVALSFVGLMLVALATTTLATTTPAPPKLTVTGATKFVPVSVTLTLAPCAPLFGLTVVSVGSGRFTVNV